MTIREALHRRIPRIRLEHWADPNAYLRLPLLHDGKYGPWADLYDDRTQLAIGLQPGSQQISVFLSEGHTADGWVEFNGTQSKYEQEAGSYSVGYLES